MSSRRQRLMAASCGLALAAMATASHAYSVEKVYLSNPATEFNALVQGSDGALYGTSPLGTFGYGSVFKLSGSTYTEIYNFSGTDGYVPRGGPVQGSDGFLYGTTSHGAVFTNGCGTVYRLSTGGTGSIIHNFSGRGIFGCAPTGELIQATDGNFYGTSSNLSPEAQLDVGNVYQLAPSGATQIIYEFMTDPATGLSPNGAYPVGGLVQAGNGLFYGVTKSGGMHNLGTVFALNNATLPATLTKLHDFDGADGGSPQSALVVGSDGALYGIAASGGVNAAGTVFRITTGGDFVKLHDFDATSGTIPNGMTLAADGALYGTAEFGGANNFGTVYRVDSGGHFSKVFDFTGLIRYPSTKLLAAGDGNLYGATRSYIFRVTGVSVGSAPTTLQMTLSPDSIPIGGSSTVSWVSKNASSCAGTSPAYFAGLSFGTTGSKVITNNAPGGGDQVYSMSCTGASGTATASATLHVVAPAPTLSFTASPSTLPARTYSTLTWTPQNASACIASDNWTGNKNVNGGSISVKQAHSGSYPYTLTCSNSQGSVTQSVTLNFQ